MGEERMAFVMRPATTRLRDKSQAKPKKSKSRIPTRSGPERLMRFKLRLGDCNGRDVALTASVRAFNRAQAGELLGRSLEKLFLTHDVQRELVLVDEPKDSPLDVPGVEFVAANIRPHASLPIVEETIASVPDAYKIFDGVRTVFASSREELSGMLRQLPADVVVTPLFSLTPEETKQLSRTEEDDDDDDDDDESEEDEG